MKAQELSRKYATAVFSLALEGWITALSGVKDKLSNDANLLKKLQDANQPFTERQAAIDKIIPASSTQNIRNFCYTLLRDGNIGLLTDVLGELERMSSGGPQVQTAYVTTAIGLPDEDKDKFRQKLRSKYGGNLEFVFNVNSSIIGGAIVQVGDKLIDGSVATRLEAMSNALGVKG